jgi:hypothetical protein
LGAWSYHYVFVEDEPSGITEASPTSTRSTLPHTSASAADGMDTTLYLAGIYPQSMARMPRCLKEMILVGEIGEKDGRARAAAGV